MESILILERLEPLSEEKQEEVLDFIEFLKNQEKKEILLAQFQTSFAKEWLTDPQEDIYEE